MDDESIRAIVAEIAPLLAGRAPGKIFQVGPLTLVIDFRLRDGYLLISFEPSLPRIHLIKRRVRDLEKSSATLTLFAQALKSELSNTTLLSIEKASDDRIVFLRFGDGNRRRDLLAQLTGRAANLFLLDEHAFDEFERPESFADLHHLNAAGRAQFTTKFARLFAEIMH